jgi:ADP-heptose:LPS heptosyltransferase/glycosyltransferase involved in cell wall biosynthesis
MTEKVYEADHEKVNGDFAGHLMSDYEKGVNDWLAGSILERWFNNQPIKTLDIGSKYPYLAHCFKNRGCEAYGMDNIEIVPEYSKELDVPMLMADFEQISEETITDWTKTNKFDLITMIHCFEHMYNPLETLKKLKKLLTDDGILFLRLPQHNVSGFERDLTSGHFTIHPFFHSFSSILELLVQAQDQFTIEWYGPMDGAGQGDIVLKPLKKKPKLYTGMIVKNEERDLPKCLDSIKNVTDGVVIIDTGSTDRTVQVARERGAFVTQYLGASKLDTKRDWKLWDFAKARNEFVNIIDSYPDADYLLWMDADDILKTPQNLKRALYLNEYDAFGVMMETDVKWVHHRMWKTRKGIHFEGAIHEYPVLGDSHTFVISDCIIHHDGAPNPGESSNQRNLRILEKEWEENPNSRTAFYLANTHKDAGRWPEAVQYYTERIKMGHFFYDEWLFSYLYKARCQRANRDVAGATATLYEAISHQPDWSEFWMELAYIFSDSGEWEKCISACLMAKNNKPAPTQLWREMNKYTDQPLRIMTFCYDNLGKTQDAINCAEQAKEAIGVEDASWDQHLDYLKSKVVKKLNGIALNRPGAIGDIIMTLNLIPELKKQNPGQKISYFCHPSIGSALFELMKDAGVDEVRDFNEFDASKFDKAINLVGYPLHENYPYTPMKRHLLEYFSDEVGIEPKIYSLEAKYPLPSTKKYATLHTKAGWSHYKDWSQERWAEVVAACPEITFIQIGAENDPKIPGAVHSFLGNPLMDSVKLIANATIHVGIDSFSNHVTNMVKTPAVILWGSTQPSAAGYEQNTNLSVGLPCQPCFKEDPRMTIHPLGPCDNPPGQTYDFPKHGCMAQLQTSTVIEAVKNLWNEVLGKE